MRLYERTDMCIDGDLSLHACVQRVYERCNIIGGLVLYSALHY